MGVEVFLAPSFSLLYISRSRPVVFVPILNTNQCSLNDFNYGIWIKNILHGWICVHAWRNRWIAINPTVQSTIYLLIDTSIQLHYRCTHASRNRYPSNRTINHQSIDTSIQLQYWCMHVWRNGFIANHPFIQPSIKTFIHPFIYSTTLSIHEQLKFCNL